MAETPPFSPTVALLTISRVWDAALTDALKPLALTTRTYGLLGHIRHSPGVSFSELARRSRITVQSAHASVAALTERGLVADATSRAGAASHLRVTDEGEKLLAAAAAALITLDATFSAEHPELTQTLRQVLERMARER